MVFNENYYINLYVKSGPIFTCNHLILKHAEEISTNNTNSFGKKLSLFCVVISRFTVLV